MKSRSHEIGTLNCRIALKFDKHIGNTAAEVPVKFQSDQTILNTHLAATRLCEILRKDVFSHSETGPCWHLPELLALMPAAGFSSPTNVDFHKSRHIQMSPHLSGYIHQQSHNSLVKNRIYDNYRSFKHSQLWAKLSLNSYKHLQNAESRGAREMEVPPLFTKMTASTTSSATRIVTMVSVKYSVFCFRILYHVSQSTLCDVIMVTKTSS